MAKRLHSGRAAQSGLYAAYLAKDGFTGIPDVLEVDYGGFLSSYSGAANIGRLTANLGEVWETALVGFKPYACVTSIHTALDTLKIIMQENSLHAEDLRSIEVGLSEMTMRHCAWPYNARSVAAAQMNLFYGLAVIALDGEVLAPQFEESRIGAPDVLELTKRITASIDPEIQALGPSGRHATRMKVTTADGRIFERFTRHRRGSPDNPLELTDLERKFRTMAAGSVDERKIDLMIELVSKIDRLSDVRDIGRLLAR